MNVVLVHGFLNGPSILRNLSQRLTAAGHACHAPKLRPSDGRSGIEDLSRQLGAFIEGAVPAPEGYAVVGFSMGALVARHFLQADGGKGRARAFFSIAGPHRGTYSAFLYPGRGTREMRIGSEFLGRLNGNSQVLAGMPVTSYWTPFDAMVRPVSSARLPFGDQVRIPAIVHTLMLSNRRLHDDLVRRLALLPA